MDICEIARKRYATKKFDATKPIPAPLVASLKELLQLSASSVNSQPWHFILAGTPEGKARIAKATQGVFEYNKNKVLQASHTIVFCGRTDMDAAYLEQLTASEDKAGRFPTPTARDEQHAKRGMYVGLHKNDWADLPLWAAKQTYLSFGSVLLGAAALGLDAVAMEGFDAQVLDEEFGLREKHLTSLVLMAVGYHAEDDFNAKLPKSRLPLEAVLTEI